MTNTITVQLKYLKISPRKARFVADVIRDLSVNEAQAQLMLSPRKPSTPILKLLLSGVAQIATRLNSDPSQCYIKEIRVDQGPIAKRWTPRARGSMSMIQKKSCHVTLTIGMKEKKTQSRFVIVKKKKQKEESHEHKSKEIKKDEVIKHEKETKSTGETSTKKEKGFLKRTFRRKAI